MNPLSHRFRFSVKFDLVGQMITPVGARDVTPRVSNRGTEYREAVTPRWESESARRADSRTPWRPPDCGKNLRWVCRAKAQRRPLRAGRGSPEAAGRSMEGAGG